MEIQIHEVEQAIIILHFQLHSGAQLDQSHLNLLWQVIDNDQMARSVDHEFSCYFNWLPLDQWILLVDEEAKGRAALLAKECQCRAHEGYYASK